MELVREMQVLFSNIWYSEEVHSSLQESISIPIFQTSWSVTMPTVGVLA